MKVVCCWTDISGYMAACWKAMVADPDIDLHVLAYAPNPQASHIEFDHSLLDGVSHHLLDANQKADAKWIADHVAGFRPDVVVTPGWCHAPFCKLVDDPRLRESVFVMSMDTPWRALFRQRLARFVLRKYLRRINVVMVTGERSWQYATRLGFPEKKIRRGCYGVNTEAMKPLFQERTGAAGGWPRSFLFVGRYVDDKGIDVLLEAYRAYRAANHDPWPLHCCGMGPWREQLVACEGIVDHGFVQPADLSSVLAEHGVFVIPSRFDPWPLAIVEACASGMPVVCSEACGSAIENVRPYYNGLTVPTGDAGALCEAMSWCHQNADQLPDFGRRGQQFAAAYSPAMWAKRWKAAFHLARESTGD